MSVPVAGRSGIDTNTYTYDSGANELDFESAAKFLHDNFDVFKGAGGKGNNSKYIDKQDLQAMSDSPEGGKFKEVADFFLQNEAFFDALDTYKNQDGKYDGKIGGPGAGDDLGAFMKDHPNIGASDGFENGKGPPMMPIVALAPPAALPPPGADSEIGDMKELMELLQGDKGSGLELKDMLEMKGLMELLQGDKGSGLELEDMLGLMELLQGDKGSGLELKDMLELMDALGLGERDDASGPGDLLELNPQQKGGGGGAPAGARPGPGPGAPDAPGGAPNAPGGAPNAPGGAPNAPGGAPDAPGGAPNAPGAPDGMPQTETEALQYVVDNWDKFDSPHGGTKDGISGEKALKFQADNDSDPNAQAAAKIILESGLLEVLDTAAGDGGAIDDGKFRKESIENFLERNKGGEVPETFREAVEFAKDNPDLFDAPHGGLRDGIAGKKALNHTKEHGSEAASKAAELILENFEVFDTAAGPDDGLFRLQESLDAYLKNNKD